MFVYLLFDFYKWHINPLHLFSLLFLQHMIAQAYAGRSCGCVHPPSGVFSLRKSHFATSILLCHKHEGTCTYPHRLPAPYLSAWICGHPAARRKIWDKQYLLEFSSRCTQLMGKFLLCFLFWWHLVIDSKPSKGRGIFPVRF